MTRLWLHTKQAIAAWIDDDAPSMGAAIAFYTAFSLAPLLIIVIAVAGIVFGPDAVHGQVVSQVQALVGYEGALAVQGLLKSAADPKDGVVATITSIVLLLIGATSVFVELQAALDRIWRMPKALAASSGIFAFLRKRMLSFGMILGLGFLMVVSLIAGAMLAALGAYWGGLYKGWETLLQLVNFGVSLALTTGLFAMIYKIMPSASIAWRDVWVGAAVTAVLFEIGKFFIGMYLGKSGVTSGFGAAGSLVVLLMWVYYAAQVFLLGAEFTWIRAGSRDSHAARTDPERSTPAGRTIADSK